MPEKPVIKIEGQLILRRENGEEWDLGKLSVNIPLRISSPTPYEVQVDQMSELLGGIFAPPKEKV